MDDPRTRIKGLNFAFGIFGKKLMKCSANASYVIYVYMNLTRVSTFASGFAQKRRLISHFGKCEAKS